MKPPEGISPGLAPIFDLEIALGNRVKDIGRDARAGTVASIRFASPLHFDEIGRRVRLPESVRLVEERPGNPAGFWCDRTAQSLGGPPVKAPLSNDEIIARLGDPLRKVVERELKLGNRIEKVEQWSEEAWWVHLRNPVHFEEHEKAGVPESLEKWTTDGSDMYWPSAMGYACCKTKSQIGGPPEGPPEEEPAPRPCKRPAAASRGCARRACSTDSGSWGLWDPAHFAGVHDYDTWEAEMLEDRDVRRHVRAGHFVPITIGEDGVAEIEVRVGTANAPAALAERERTHLKRTSETYILRTTGLLCFDGVERLAAKPAAETARVRLPAGDYAVTVHWIAWDKEPGAVDAKGNPTKRALADFVALVNPVGKWRRPPSTRLDTFRGRG